MGFGGDAVVDVISVVIGFSDMLSIAQTVGIVGTMVLTLIFSKRHIQSLLSHQQTRVLNDLDEKVRKMAEIIIEGWLHWIKNCFKYGTIGEQWAQIRSEGWLNPAFENFVNREIILDRL